jgi:hypothetical protein
MRMQIKARKYVYRVYRPVKGAWRSGKKADLLEKIKEPQGLLEDVVRQEGRQRQPGEQPRPLFGSASRSTWGLW